MLKSNVFVGVKPLLNQNAYFEDEFKSINEKSVDYLLLPITNTKYRNTVKNYYMGFQDPIHMLSVPAPQLQELSISPKTHFQSNDADGNTRNSYSGFTEKTANSNSSNVRSGPIRYIGLVSSWIELESSDVSIRELSYQVLQHEWEYAKFVGIEKMILAPPRNLQNLNEYASMISRLLNSNFSGAENDFKNDPVLSISLPIFEDSNPLSTWELWNTIRNLVDYHPNFTISLALPKYKTPSYVLERWINEPVSFLLLSSSIFSPNRFNVPVLNKYNQEIIYQFQKLNGNQLYSQKDLVVILHGLEKYANYFEKFGGEQSYLDYTNFLLHKGDKKLLKKHESLISSYNGDVSELLTSKLIPPLKPISENLPNNVYHVFEQDSTKYEQYETAIFAALQDLRAQRFTDGPLKILVAGAGRGPLVTRVYNALRKLGFQKNQYHIMAIEKNPHAFLYLQKKNFQDWNNEVEIFKEDIRNLPIPVEDRVDDKFDLIVSELLGSFGCNELCPEILQFLDLYFTKTSTIFIPWKYTSYMAPVSSSNFYQRLNLTDSKSVLEKPWIIHNIPYSIVSSKVHELWSFTHNAESATSNGDVIEEDGYSLTFLERSVSTKFKIKHKCEIHGLLGFFSANLYKDSVILSILPKKPIKFLKGNNSDMRNFQHTKNLNSWSPMMFPFKQPFYVTDDTELEVFFNRINDGRRSWYEWCAQSFIYLVTDQVPLNVADTSVKRDFKEDDDFLTDEKPLGNNATTSMGNTNVTDDGNHFIDTDGLQTQNFVSIEETGWQSVHDIHNLLIKGDSTKRDSYMDAEVTKILSRPLFDLKLDSSKEAVGKNISGASKVENNLISKPQELTIECADDKPIEYHVRIKANGITLHNVNGRHFNMPLSL